jgi:hypothetical protein
MIEEAAGDQRRFYLVPNAESEKYVWRWYERVLHYPARGIKVRVTRGEEETLPFTKEDRKIYERLILSRRGGDGHIGS